METINVRLFTHKSFRHYGGREQVEKNSVQVTNSLYNFMVSEANWDIGMPIGNGRTLEQALASFEVSYELKYDEEVKAVVKTNY